MPVFSDSVPWSLGQTETSPPAALPTQVVEVRSGLSVPVVVVIAMSALALGALLVWLFLREQGTRAGLAGLGTQHPPRVHGRDEPYEPEMW